MKCFLGISHRIDLDSVILKNSILNPIYCGAIYKTEESLIMRDNTGDNISKERNSLGELTVQYWIWKNISADYYGLCHYRRYFAFGSINGKRNEQNQIYLAYLSKKNIKKYKLNDEKIIENICSEYDVVIPEGADVTKITTQYGKVKTVEELWLAHKNIFFDEKIFNDLTMVIKNKYPEFYKTYNEYFNSKYHIGYNCYIMKKELFYDLSKLQFGIINTLKNECGEKEYYKLYPRTYGYIGEMIFGCYVYNLKKNYNVKELPLVFFEITDDNIFNKNVVKGIFRFYAKYMIDIFFPKNTFIRKILKNFYHKFIK